MAKSAEEIKKELARTKRLQSPPAISSHCGAGTSPKLRQRTEPRAAGKSQRLIGGPQNVHRALPHAELAEKGVLSCMIKAPAVVVPIAQQAVAPDYFYIPKNQQLFADICGFFNDEGLFDLTTLTQHLINVGHIDSVGGPGYVTELAIDFGTVPEMVSHYVDILRDKYALRQIIKAGTQAAHRAQTLDEASNAADIFDDLFSGLESARSSLRSSLRLPALCDISNYLGTNQPPLPPELVKGILHQGSKLIVGWHVEGT